jgi:hypothetical protein
MLILSLFVNPAEGRDRYLREMGADFSGFDTSCIIAAVMKSLPEAYP